MTKEWEWLLQIFKKAEDSRVRPSSEPSKREISTAFASTKCQRWKKSPPDSICIYQSLVEIIEVLNIGQPRTEVYPVVNTKNLGTSLSKMVETVGE